MLSYLRSFLYSNRELPSVLLVTTCRFWSCLSSWAAFDRALSPVLFAMESFHACLSWNELKQSFACHQALSLILLVSAGCNVIDTLQYQLAVFRYMHSAHDLSSRPRLTLACTAGQPRSKFALRNKRDSGNKIFSYSQVRSTPLRTVQYTLVTCSPSPFAKHSL